MKLSKYLRTYVKHMKNIKIQLLISQDTKTVRKQVGLSVWVTVFVLIYLKIVCRIWDNCERFYAILFLWREKV